MVSREDGKKLLELARRAVKAAASGDRLPDVPPDEVFHRRGGVFVTLKKHGMLRGCIGHFIGKGTLGETVVEMAAAAATGDPRFPPVRPGEVDELDIEISLLSPMVPSSPEEVVPGRHGVYIRRGNRAGTLLPQVAAEEGWDRETLLAHTCLKAGLSPDCWKMNDVDLYTYTAQVIREIDEREESR